MCVYRMVYVCVMLDVCNVCVGVRCVYVGWCVCILWYVCA